MKRAYRIVLLVLLFAALPLRGYAGVLMALCESHHGGAAVAEQHAHGHGDGQHHDSGDGAGGPTHAAASICSMCASCSASAGLAPATNHGIAFQVPDVLRISFFDSQVSGFIPEHLERPPLAL